MHITISGRRWFDKVNGNTYFSAIGCINDKQVVNIKFSYGYGNQFEYEVVKELKHKQLLPGIEEKESLWQYCERTGTTKLVSVTDVSRKKDMYFNS